MPLRLRLFVKKRGTRRTSARWQGMLGEAALDVILLGVGTYFLYWLSTNYLFAENSPGVWPWLVGIIPLVLAIYGIVGLALLAWKSGTSAERRAAVAKRAAEWDPSKQAARADQPSLPTVPPIDAVIDSPGVQLAYRLPVDAASGWVSATMAAVCLAWNGGDWHNAAGSVASSFLSGRAI
jgi:hypothetical protein